MGAGADAGGVSKSGMLIESRRGRVTLCLLSSVVGVACGDGPATGSGSATVPELLAWEHDRDEVVTMPVVVDVNGDGLPEVLINSARATSESKELPIGELVCLDGGTGIELWRIPHDPARGQFGTNGRSTVAAGDVSGDGKPDIVYAGRPEGSLEYSLVHAVDGAGQLLWSSRLPTGEPAKLRVGVGAPALVNLDDDPQAEIAFGAAIFDHDGVLVWNQDDRGASIGSPLPGGESSVPIYLGSLPSFADLTGDGYPELITGREAWTIDWVPGAAPTVTLALLWRADSGVGGDGYPAIADLDGNGTPEVVLTAWPEIKVLDGATGKLWCGVDATGAACTSDDSRRTQPIEVPGNNLGGPAVIADFDGDGRPEFGIASGSEFTMFDLNRDGESVDSPAGAEAPNPGEIFALWSTKIQDDSSGSAGASAFDFEGDGVPEVLYQDECFARVLDGATGAIRHQIMNSSLTGHEYPVPADVDGDGLADLVVVANLGLDSTNDKCLEATPDFVPNKGVRVFRAENGAPTHSAWTMHSYHVTNVAEDGNVPVTEQDHWAQPAGNSFRAGENL